MLKCKGTYLKMLKSKVMDLLNTENDIFMT